MAILFELARPQVDHFRWSESRRFWWNVGEPGAPLVSSPTSRPIAKDRPAPDTVDGLPPLLRSMSGKNKQIVSLLAVLRLI